MSDRLWRYHAYEWEGTVMMDLRLMFGHTAGPGSFTELSDAVVRRVKSEGCPGVVAYIDDFLIVFRLLSDCHLP